jgi:hypothetical protein
LHAKIRLIWWSIHLRAKARRFLDIQEAEGLLNIIFDSERRTGKQFTELIDELAEFFIKIENNDFMSWSHSLCHLFENYAPHDDGSRSFLDNPARFGAAKKLIDETVRRAIAVRRTECTHRIMEPFITYNLAKMTAENLDGDFPFRPESVMDKGFAELQWDGHVSASIRLFCTATTPREFLVSISGIAERDERIFPKSIAGLIETVQGDVLTKIEMAKNAAEEVAGLYVDVDGTLIVGGKLNARVLQTMEKAAEDGKAVRIFTGGNPEKQTERLQALGVPEKFLPAIQKSDFTGKIMEWVIDDARLEYQGIKAKRHDYPSD